MKSRLDDTPASAQQSEWMQGELTELARASAALQETVDVLAKMTDLDNFVQAALEITARAFESKNCSYFEHRGDDPVRLVHRFLGDKVLSREEFLLAYGDDPEYVDSMLNGFMVEDCYFGVPLRERTRPSVIDHAAPDRNSCLDRHCRSRGWTMELNVPLMIAGRAEGALVIERAGGALYTAGEVALAERLGQQLALAMEVSRLTREAGQAANAREEERAAKLRADEIDKSSKALQDIVDALATMPDLDQFIPAALRIVARAFDTNHCSYFENGDSDPVRLHYWFLEDRVLSRDDIFELGDEYDDMKSLATGFTVDDSYFGIPLRDRTRASVVDHEVEGRDSHIDVNCRAHGWHLELNVPLVVAGRAVGEIVVQRGRGNPYSATEVALAERLGQQLALAMQVSRLSEEAKQTAVIRERERASLERADEITRFSRALRVTLDSLVSETDFLGFVGCLLQNAAEQIEAPVVEYWRMDSREISKLILTCRDGRIFDGSDMENDIRIGGVRVEPGVIGADSVSEMATYFLGEDVRNDPYVRLMFDSTGFDLQRWCEERNVYRMIGLPLIQGDRAFGVLCAYLPQEREFNQAKIDVAHSFAQQLALSVRLAELAEESKQAAVLRERETVAQGRADQITQFSGALRKTLDSLVDEYDFPRFTGDLLVIASEQLQAPVVEYWKVVDDETVALSLTCREGVLFQGSDIENDVRVRGLKVIPEVMDSPTLGGRKTHFLNDDLANDPWQEVLFKGTGFNVPKWCKERGVHRLINLPLLRDGQDFGALIAYLPEDRRFDQAKIDVAYSFAQQLALSIRLTELAEESKQAAISREREQATQERAAEFAKANAVLRSTLDQLAANRDLHSFPRTILTEAMKQMNGHDGVIFLVDVETQTLRVSELIAPGASPSDVSEVMAVAIPVGSVAAWPELVEKREAVVLDVERDEARLLPGAPEWLKRRGNKSVIAAPLFLGAEPYGYFSIALHESAEEVSKVSLGLIQALTQQANLAIQLTRMAETSQQSAIALERQHVVIQERAHMAREIHDRLAQGYAAILMQQHAMRRALKQGIKPMDGQPEALIEHLDIIERLSKDNLAEARKTMDELRLDPLGPSDLERSLEACVAQINGRHGFDVYLELHGDIPSVPHYLEIEVCRVVGEAIANARKHSRAGSVKVCVQRMHDRFAILIHDNGVGFDTQATTSSFGIASMYERAARAGGELTIKSAPGHGTQVLLMLNIR